MRRLRPGGGGAGEERPAEVSSCCATSCSCQLSLRRAEILAAHNSIPALMSGWRAEEALAAARTKLRLTRGLGDQLATLLPSALLELHEMSSLAQVPPWKTTLPPVHVCCAQVLGRPGEETSHCVAEARQLSALLGPCFEDVCEQKLQQIQRECLQLAASRGK